MREWPVFGIQGMRLSNQSFNQHLLNPLQVKQSVSPGETEMFKTGIVSAYFIELTVYARVCQLLALEPFGAR